MGGFGPGERRVDSDVLPVRPQGDRAAGAPAAGTGRGFAKVQQLINAPRPPLDQIAQVFVENPRDRDAILRLLHGDPRVGNAGVRQIVMLADSSAGGAGKIDWSRYELKHFGKDPSDTSYLQGMQVAEGGGAISDVKTTRLEGYILNAIRAEQIRLKPAFLRALQHALGVANASGAMNTETLRALLKQPQLAGIKAIPKEKEAAKAAADIIVNDAGQWLEALVPAADRQAVLDEEAETSANHAEPGKQHHPTAFTATATTTDAFNPDTPAEERLKPDDTSYKNGHRGDRVAKALGFTSYADYKSKWVKLDFLGGDFGKWSDVHPAINQRLAVAAAWLRQRHPNKNDEEVRKAIKWNGLGAGGYGSTEAFISGDKPGDGFVPGVHMHSFGLAFDIDTTNNPYVLGGSSGGHFWNNNMEEHLRRSAQLYGGEALTAEKMNNWSASLSTEELFAKVDRANQSFKKYLAEPKSIAVTDPAMQLRKPTAAERKTVKDVDSQERAAYKQEMHDHQTSADKVRIQPLAAKLVAIAGYAQDDANKAASDWLDFTLDYHGDFDQAIWSTVHREGATGLTTHTQDLVVALRDVAGFMWGGTEMSSVENGDFMHFDLRNTSFGDAVYKASISQVAATDSATDRQKKADEVKAAKAAAKAAPKP
jgi:hypothetical protein